MKKTQYQKELLLSAPQRRGGANSKKEVQKIQSWLTLYELSHPGSGTAVEVDGSFGPATEAAVLKWQQLNGFAPTGRVDLPVFEALADPLRRAFTTLSGGATLRDCMVRIAQQHLTQHPSELSIGGETNSGPWVRGYMDGNEGQPWFWCMGFAQAILDQAASEMGKDFSHIVPLTYSCDTVGTHGHHAGSLIRNMRWRQNPALAQPGDLFLLRRSPFDWFHTGIILRVTDEVIETIEGNTDLGGTANGTGVFQRIRNYQQKEIDVFSISALA